MSTPKKTAEPMIRRSSAIVIAVACFLGGLFLGNALNAILGGPVETSQVLQSGPAGDGGATARLAALEKRTRETPGEAKAWTELGNAYFDAGEAQKAVTAYEKSLSLAPGNPDVLTDLGVMYRQVGQPRKAVECFEKAVAANPGHVIAHFNKSVVLLHDLDDPAGALAVLEALAARDPNAAMPGGRPLSEMIGELRKKLGPGSAGEKKDPLAP